MQRVLTNRQQDTGAAVYRTAWAGVELGLSYGARQPDASRQLFAGARQQLDTLVDPNDEHVVHYRASTITMLGAATLQSFLPAFLARSQSDNIFEEADCRKLYSDLGTVLARFKPGERRQNRGHIDEVEVMALAAYVGDPSRLLWPASPREESSRNESALNHDVYEYEPSRSNQKIPIQIKNSRHSGPGRSYSPAVASLYFEDILKAAGYKKQGQTLAETIMRDASGNGNQYTRSRLKRAAGFVMEFVDERRRVQSRLVPSAEGSI
jgi:hypothetical protein